MKTKVTIVLFAMILLLSSCAQSPVTAIDASDIALSNTPDTTAQITIAPSSTPIPTQAAAYPVSIQNYTRIEGGTVWTPKETVYEKAPERIVATTRTAAEFLIHMGLGDKIVGVGGVFGEIDQEVAGVFDTLHLLGESYISKEVALSVDPDFIFGRGGLFDNADWGVGTVDSLNDMGINTYVMESSVTDASFDSIYKDIENLGNIFQVQEQAAAFAQMLHTRQDAVINALTSIEKENTFAYIHESDPENFVIYAASTDSFFNSTFEMLRLKNAFAGVEGEISIESLIEKDPDILIALHWAGDDPNAPRQPQDTIDNILQNKKLSSMKAIQNKQVFVMDYNHLFGYSYHTLDGLEILAKQIYPEQVK